MHGPPALEHGIRMNYGIDNKGLNYDNQGSTSTMD